MLFINTRPSDRAKKLTESLTAHQFKVIDLPLLVLKARPFDVVLKRLYQQLLSTQIVVVVSPTAVEIGMKYLHDSGLSIDQISHIQWIAVGKKTAHCLNEHGITAIVPEVETSEGMLSLPIFKHMSNLNKIAFWRGEGGRQFMMQQCLANNIEVLNFILYERACPLESQLNIASTISNIEHHHPPYWVCVSSEASWINWLNLFKNSQYIIENSHYLVLGERLYNLLINDKNESKYKFDVTLIQDLNPQTILQTIGLSQRHL